MKEMTIKEVLLSAKILIDTEDKWTKNRMACNNKGQEVNVHDSEAVCFCLLGAVLRAGISPEGYRTIPGIKAERELQNTLVAQGKEGYISGFNDIPTTTYQEVIGLLDKTIENLK